MKTETCGLCQGAGTVDDGMDAREDCGRCQGDGWVEIDPPTRDHVAAYLDGLGATLWARSFDLSETHSREQAIDFVLDLLDGLGR